MALRTANEIAKVRSSILSLPLLLGQGHGQDKGQSLESEDESALGLIYASSPRERCWTCISEEAAISLARIAHHRQRHERIWLTPRINSCENAGEDCCAR
jgi:hypothetical protein